MSLDGCAALFRPCESKLALHVDQVPQRQGCDWGSVQGAYNLYAVDADEPRDMVNAGFVCVVGSHMQYDSLWAARTANAAFQLPAKHWHVLEEASPLQQQACLITSPANSLVLWRSDVLHKNYGGDYTCTSLGTESEPRLARLTQFVTFQPKKYRTKQVLERKAQAVIDGVSNNHWAALAVRVPIVPFPAWSAAAKKIRIVRPFGELTTEETGNTKSDHKEALTEVERSKRNMKKRKCSESNESAEGVNKTKDKKPHMLTLLPMEIQELL